MNTYECRVKDQTTEEKAKSRTSGDTPESWIYFTKNKIGIGVSSKEHQN